MAQYILGETERDLVTHDRLNHVTKPAEFVKFDRPTKQFLRHMTNHYQFWGLEVDESRSPRMSTACKTNWKELLVPFSTGHQLHE